MTRPPRLDAPGQWHHVMNRGAGRRLVFRDDHERRWFIEDLGRLDSEFGLEVHAFCLMGNHYHLLVRSRDGRLSDALKWLAQHYTHFANERRGVDGPIFRGRFHSVRVENEDHLDWLYRYVNANPRDLGWTGPLIEYPWSGLAQSLGLRHDQPWLHTDRIIERFGSLTRFHEFVVREPIDTGEGFRAVQRSISWPTVVAAAHTASLQDGWVIGEPAARAVALVVGVDHGLGVRTHPSIGPLGAARRAEALARARARIENDIGLTRFADRVVDLVIVSIGGALEHVESRSA